VLKECASVVAFDINDAYNGSYEALPLFFIVLLLFAA
jgi:hypothetical protein